MPINQSVMLTWSQWDVLKISNQYATEPKIVPATHHLSCTCDLKVPSVLIKSGAVED